MKKMRNVLILILVLFDIVDFCFAQTKHLGREDFVKNGNTEIKISHSNTLYSIALHFYEIEKSSKFGEGIFKSIIPIPEGDSIAIFLGDDYHYNVFKRTRKILYSNYDSIISSVNPFNWGDVANRCTDPLGKAWFFCDYSKDGILYSKEMKEVFPYDLLNMDSLMIKLGGFAKLIHYDDFFRENYDVYYEFITGEMPCVEDMRIWMNSMFDINCQSIVFLTSPFAEAYCSYSIYDNADKSAIIISGGVPVLNDDNTCGFTSDFETFQSLMAHFINRIKQMNPTIFENESFNEKIETAMFLLYCHDMQSEETFKNEKELICCVFKKWSGAGFEDFIMEVELLYNQLMERRDQKEKNLLHIYMDLLEKNANH